VVVARSHKLPGVTAGAAGAAAAATVLLLLLLAVVWRLQRMAAGARRICLRAWGYGARYPRLNRDVVVRSPRRGLRRQRWVDAMPSNGDMTQPAARARARPSDAAGPRTGPRGVRELVCGEIDLSYGACNDERPDGGEWSQDRFVQVLGFETKPWQEQELKLANVSSKGGKSACRCPPWAVVEVAVPVPRIGSRRIEEAQQR
jgi:hypothetical protein